MFKRGFAAMCAAAAITAAAGQAQAALVNVTWGGYYASGIGPNGPYARQDSTTQPTPGVQPTGYDFTLNFTFDTSRGQVTNTPLGAGSFSQALSWNPAMGGVSPLVSATLSAFGQTFSFDGSSSFSLDRNPTLGGFSIVDGDRSIDGYLFDFSAVPSDTAYRLDDEFSSILWNAPCCTNVSVGGYTGQGYTYLVSQERAPSGPNFAALAEVQQTSSPLQELAPVPEPGTWALLILGFGGIGAVLRRTRRQTAQASAA